MELTPQQVAQVLDRMCPPTSRRNRLVRETIAGMTDEQREALAAVMLDKATRRIMQIMDEIEPK